MLQDFAALQLGEMTAGIQSRRTKIFLLMEEVRRLRIQERLKVPPPLINPDLLDAFRGILDCLLGCLPVSELDPDSPSPLHWRFDDILIGRHAEF